MEGSTFDLRSYKLEQDKLTRQGDVMPDSWDGHARITIRESDVIDPQIEDKAIQKVLALADKNGVTPATAANRLIRAMADQD